MLFGWLKKNKEKERDEALAKLAAMKKVLSDKRTNQQQKED